MLSQIVNRFRKTSRKSKNRNRDRASQRRSLLMESLEDRRLLATVTLSNGTNAFVDDSSATRTVAFNTGHFPSGSIINDVNARVQFTKTDGSCESPASGGAFHNEIVYRLTSPAGTTRNMVNAGTYSGGTDIGTVTVTFDDSASSFPSGTPTTGTFKPVQSFSAFNGQNPLGTWSLFIEDTVGSDPLCHFDFQLTVSATVPNVSPTAQANGPYTVAEGGNVTLSSSGSFDPDGSINLYQWDFNYTGTFTVDATGPSPTFSAAGLDGPASRTVALRVRDDDGAFSAIDTATLNVTNVAPTLSNVAITSPIDENDFATLSGNISDPGTPDTFTLTVDWGEGAPVSYPLAAGATSFSVSHQYLDDNPTGTPSDLYVISGTLVDDDGGSAALGGVSGSGSGVVNEVESNNTVATAQNIDGLWSLAFSSDIGDMTTNTSTTIPHVTVIGTGDNSVDVYEFTVPAAGTKAIFDVDYGMFDFDPWLYLRDSSGAVIAANDDAPTSWGQGGSAHHYDSYLEYTFSAAGVYYIEVGRYPSGQPIPSGADYELQVSLDSLLAVTVNNVDPTLSGLSATPILENGTTTLSGTIADVGTLDTFTVEIDWDNDGTYDESHTGVGAGAFSYTHQYLDDDPTATPVDNMPINVKVTDDDTGSVTDSTTVEVTNVAPSLDNLAVTSSINENDFATLSADIIDPGTLDVFTLVVDWGEGPAETFTLPAGSTSFAVTHQYLDDNPTNTPSDTYNVSIVSFEDDDGGTAGVSLGGNIFLTGHDILSHGNQNGYSVVALDYLVSDGLRVGHSNEKSYAEVFARR